MDIFNDYSGIEAVSAEVATVSILLRYGCSREYTDTVSNVQRRLGDTRVASPFRFAHCSVNGVSVPQPRPPTTKVEITTDLVIFPVSLWAGWGNLSGCDEQVTWSALSIGLAADCPPVVRLRFSRSSSSQEMHC